MVCCEGPLSWTPLCGVWTQCGHSVDTTPCPRDLLLAPATCSLPPRAAPCPRDLLLAPETCSLPP
eukprot:254404-Chlamydomonas_euryale.AAC.1